MKFIYGLLVVLCSLFAFIVFMALDTSIKRNMYIDQKDKAKIFEEYHKLPNKILIYKEHHEVNSSLGSHTITL